VRVNQPSSGTIPDTQKSREYRQATNGYYARLGDKNAYKDAYRQAFLQDYSSSVRNRNGRDRNNGCDY